MIDFFLTNDKKKPIEVKLQVNKQGNKQCAVKCREPIRVHIVCLGSLAVQVCQITLDKVTRV